MTDRLELSEPLIQPVYPQTEPNEPIELGQEAIQFEHNGATHDEIANVRMRFTPDHRLEFVVSLESKAPSFGLSFVPIPGTHKSIKLTDRSVDIEAFIVAVSSERGIVFAPRHSAVVVAPRATTISKVVFHLFNFPDFNGPESYVLRTIEPPNERSQLCGRVVLEADGWRITLAATDRTIDMAKRLREQGGFALTHMGQIERQDGEAFTVEEFEEIYSCLHYFLSFAMGRWAGIALPIGFDVSGNRVYERWGLGRIGDGSWHSACSWWHEDHAEWLAHVFPGFLSLWKSSLWRQPLTHVLYWYIHACKGVFGLGVDTGLILAQTALETLAWTYCVHDRKMVSAKAFEPRGLSAADRLRLLTTSMGIPTEIPPVLSALHAKPSKKWEDGMEAVTEMRNSLVHPNKRAVKLPDGSWFEAWKLSLWYINLALLHLCGYNGRYFDRLAQVTTMEPVPWAPKSVS